MDYANFREYRYGIEAAKGEGQGHYYVNDLIQCATDAKAHSGRDPAFTYKVELFRETKDEKCTQLRLIIIRYRDGKEVKPSNPEE